MSSGPAGCTFARGTRYRGSPRRGGVGPSARAFLQKPNNRSVRGHQRLGRLLTDELTNKSDQLLDALLRLRTAEQQLRHLRISSEEFHRLAEEVEVLRDELSALARDGRDTTQNTIGWPHPRRSQG
jgi:hypothetical protein